jgi:hypothetical protein
MLSSVVLASLALPVGAPPELAVSTAFPGGSAKVESIDQAARVVTIRPVAHKDRGWDCWWAFKLTGVRPGETVTVRVTGSTGFARPDRASTSTDGKTWVQTAPGTIAGTVATYKVTAAGKELWLAWGPPYQLADAKAAVDRVAAAKVGGAAFELCRSKDGHAVPGLRWEPPAKDGGKRPGLWVQARQHAWESGGSWVCQGFLDYLTSDDPDAKRLRETVRIVVVPVMDADNVERGAGGKNGVPHDHNRDWSDKPVWPEVAAAQKLLAEMDAAGELDLFLDLHNPAPNDKVPFFFGPPDDLLPAARRANQERFLTAAAGHLKREPLKLADKVRTSGPEYDKMWRVISKNWVAARCRAPVVALTLETSWNTPNSTADGYRAYGRALGRAVAEYLGARAPAKP